MGGVTWWQNWTAFPDKTLGGGNYSVAGVEYVPMVWGADFAVSDLQAQIPAAARYFLTFNLPNFTTDAAGMKQANVTASVAASRWTSTIQPFADSRSPPLLLVSPSVDYCDPPAVCIAEDPNTWLSGFLKDCTDCRIDFIGVASHRCDLQDLLTDLNGIENTVKGFFPAGKPLWITSFGCQDPDAGIASFMQDAVASLEQQNPSVPVFRYAWFTGRTNDGGPTEPWDLLEPEAGVLTPLGQTYVNLPSSGQ